MGQNQSSMASKSADPKKDADFPAGKYSAVIGSVGVAAGQFNAPQGLAVDAKAGPLFVADGKNLRVQVFATAGKFVREYKVEDAKSMLVDVAVSADAIFATNDSTVWKIGRSDGKVSATISGENIAGLACDGNELFVSEAKKSCVSVYSVATALLVRTLAGGEGASAVFDGPLGLAVNGDNLLVANTGAKKVAVLTKAGAAVRTLNTGADLKLPTCIAVSGDRVIVTDLSNGNVTVAALDGSKLVRTFGSQGTGPGEFLGIRGVAVLGGKLYVADPANHRVQIFD